MKYSQFLEFSQLLEANKTNLEDWKKNPSKLFEAEGVGSEMNLSGGEENKEENKEKNKEKEKDPDALETKSSKLDWATKKGRMRKSLNKQAKKLQDGINKEVAGKLLKPISDMKVQVYKKMAEIGKGKQPKDIVNALKGDLQNIQKIQTKQMGAIEKHIQNSIDNTTTKIKSAIGKKGLKETTVADLESYWSLLTTQIFNNILQKIAINDDKVITEVIKDQDILKAAKQINAALNKPQKKKEAELKAEIEKLKGEIKKRDEATTPATPETPEGTPAEPENTETK